MENMHDVQAPISRRLQRAAFSFYRLSHPQRGTGPPTPSHLESDASSGSKARRLTPSGVMKRTCANLIESHGGTVETLTVCKDPVAIRAMP